MKVSVLALVLTALVFSCKKKIPEPQDKVMNGVNVNVAVSTFNSFRTQGISGHPAVGALAWNDTLSNAAYNFAKAKTEDTNTPASVYKLSNGQFILDFPKIMHYSRFANFALHYDFPADTDVKTVINAGFNSTDQSILSGLMSSTATQFGMGQFGGKWYLIMSN